MFFPESWSLCPGMFHAKFHIAGIILLSPFLEIAKYGPLWPKHSPHLVLKIGSSWILINVPRDVPCQISHCWVYPVAPFPINGQNMALLWPKNCPQMVLNIRPSWILITVPRDVPCQFSHDWVYPIDPFPKNGQNMALLWPKHGLYGVLQIFLPEP